MSSQSPGQLITEGRRNSQTEDIREELGVGRTAAIQQRKLQKTAQKVTKEKKELAILPST